MLLKISQNPQKNTCVRVSFVKDTPTQTFSYEFCEIFWEHFFIEHLLVQSYRALSTMEAMDRLHSTSTSRLTSKHQWSNSWISNYAFWFCWEISIFSLRVQGGISKITDTVVTSWKASCDARETKICSSKSWCRNNVTLFLTKISCFPSTSGATIGVCTPSKAPITGSILHWQKTLNCSSFFYFSYASGKMNLPWN